MTSGKVKKQLPRSAWITIIAWAASLLFCVTFWFLRLGGDLKVLTSARTTLGSEREILDGIRKDVASLPDLKRNLAAAKADLYGITNSYILTPLLNSYAMRSKTILEAAAGKSGFVMEEIREHHHVPLPTVSMESELFFDRLGVEVSGNGSYFQIADFVAGVEKTLPYTSVAGITISAQRTTPIEQKAVIVLEWPVLGLKPLDPPSKKEGES